MQIFAFAGTRYTDAATAGPLAGPPYDQIDDVLQEQLHSEPLHFAHLIRPQGADTLKAHRQAAALHRQWKRTEWISRDPTPALYPYQIALAAGGRRLGICTLVRIEDDASGIIRPHEATVAKTVDERLSLLCETRVDLEPILMLADDAGAINRLLDEDLRQLAALVTHSDANGNRHRLYRLTAVERIALYRNALQPCAGLIADGHHRYTVAQRYLNRTTAPTAAAGAKLAVITSLTSDALTIDPIHRLLPGSHSLEAVADTAAHRWPLDGRTGAAIAQAVADARQPAVGISIEPDRHEIWELDPSTVPATLPQHLHHLAVGWLHGVLLAGMGLAAAAATDGTVLYRSDPERLFAELATTRPSTAFWLPPMSADDFSRAMSGGQILPPKSTRFLPKVASGLVWAEQDCALL